jgi:hypothetical protein
MGSAAIDCLSDISDIILKHFFSLIKIARAQQGYRYAVLGIRIMVEIP